MTLGLSDEEGVATGAGLEDLLAGPWDAVAAGPGLGTGRGCRDDRARAARPARLAVRSCLTRTP